MYLIKCTMKKLTKILIIALMALCIVSCHKITEGTVVDKWHKPRRTTVMHINTGHGFMLVPRTLPPVWAIVLEKDGVRETFYVNQCQYDSIQIGMYFEVH